MRHTKLLIKLISISVALILCSCNAVDVPEFDVSSETSSSHTVTKQQLTQTQTTISAVQADSNVRFSVVKEGSPVDLSSEDKIVFELRNNALEIVQISKLAEKQAQCNDKVKALMSKDDMVICNTYIQKKNLTDIVILTGSEKHEVASWVFDETNPDLVLLKIKLK